MVLTRQQSRRVDQIAIEQFLIPGIILMENAGRNCAELILKGWQTGTVCILAGKGNNAGDGFVIARHLHNQGVPVKIVLLETSAEFRGDTLTNWHILAKLPISCQQFQPETESAWTDLLEKLQSSEWIIDAMLGTGLQGPLRQPYREFIQRLASWQLGKKLPPVFAIDLPSGLNADAEMVDPICLSASQTATFVDLKPVFLTPDGKQKAGEIHVVDIGVPPEVLAVVCNETKKGT